MQQSFSMKISSFASWTYPEGKLSSLKKFSLGLEFCSLDQKGYFIRSTYKINSDVSPRITGLQSGCCLRNFILLRVPWAVRFQTVRGKHGEAESFLKPCLFIQQSKSILSKSGWLSKQMWFETRGRSVCVRAGRHTRRQWTSVFVSTIKKTPLFQQ